MKTVKKTIVACALLPALLLAGCGDKETATKEPVSESGTAGNETTAEDSVAKDETADAEIALKEFVSEDGSVSIQMDETWKTEVMGANTEGWVAAFKDDGEGIVVMQAPKHIYNNVGGMDAWKELVETSYQISGTEPMGAVSVPGMEVEGVYSATITSVDSVDGKAYVLYGETDYAFYNILYGAEELNEEKKAYFQSVCSTFKETAPEIENNSTVESTDTIQWFNNTCAVLTAANNWDYTIFGGLPANDYSQSVVQELLSGWWDVTDRASADESLEWLLTEGHRVDYVDNMEILADSGLGNVAEDDRIDFLLENFAMDDEEAQNYADWYGWYEQYGDDAVTGWDYSRAMSLCGFYYLAGYYTEEEALDQSLEIAGIIQETFDSWDSLMESYFLGYEYWAEESSDERRALYEEIKAAPDNPYGLDWNLTLEKSW